MLSSNSVELIFEASASAVERGNYGLSWPLTYSVDKPTSWTDQTPYQVWYKDADTSWQPVIKKTTNDWFNAINCYRDEGSMVIVSQALPQWSDSFQIRIRKDPASLIAERSVAIELVPEPPQVVVWMVEPDTNALYSLYYCDDLASNVWIQTEHRGFKPDSPCTNIFIEPTLAPQRFYKLLWDYDE